MMRNLLFSAMIAGLAFGSGAAYAAVSAFPGSPSQGPVSAAHTGTQGPLRWFTEQPGAAASQTPYGNNPSVGHTVQAGDAKIYYEIYGTPQTGTPVFVFHGGRCRRSLRVGDTDRPSASEPRGDCGVDARPRAV